MRWPKPSAAFAGALVVALITLVATVYGAKMGAEIVARQATTDTQTIVRAEQRMATRSSRLETGWRFMALIESQPTPDRRPCKVAIIATDLTLILEESAAEKAAREKAEVEAEAEQQAIYDWECRVGSRTPTKREERRFRARGKKLVSAYNEAALHATNDQRRLMGEIVNSWGRQMDYRELQNKLRNALRAEAAFEAS